MTVFAIHRSPVLKFIVVTGILASWMWGQLFIRGGPYVRVHRRI